MEPNEILATGAVALASLAFGFIFAAFANRRWRNVTAETVDIMPRMMSTLEAQAKQIDFQAGQINVLKTNYQILYTEIDTMRRKTIPAMQAQIDALAMIETAQAANGSQPDTCLLCGRKANDIYTVDDILKLTYGLCLTCSAKPASHVTACDVIARRLPQTTVMSRNLYTIHEGLQKPIDLRSQDGS